MFTLLLATSRSAICLADASAEDRAAAQALFDEGRGLVQSGSATEGCTKFEESERLDPSIGTQLNLADCYERTGKSASAWTLYIEVAAAARKAGQPERASLASARATALQASLSRLIIVVPESARVAELVVERGSITVGKAQWGTPIPVDPGTHVVMAHAPGKKPWKTTIIFEAGALTKTITVPTLAEDTVLGRAQSSRKTQRTVALVAGGVGVAGLIAGSVFGLRAMTKKSDAGCDGNLCANEEQKRDYEQAQQAGTAATIAFAAGGAVLAGGLVLYLTAPKDPERPEAGLRAQASVNPQGATVSAGVQF